MNDNLDLEQLRSQMRDQYNNRNYSLALELANKILQNEPEDYFALEYRLYSSYSIKQAAPDEEKEEKSKEYIEYALEIINYLENKCNINEDSNKKRTYQVARNNIAWEAYLHGKTKDKWENGLNHVDIALEYGEEPYMLDTKLRLLLKLGRNDDAYRIALLMLKKNEFERDVQDIKVTNKFKEWVKANSPEDLNIVDKYASINPEEMIFLQELETILNRSVPWLKEDQKDTYGFREENGKIIYLNIYSLYNLESIPQSLGNLINLQELTIKWCNSLTALPETVGNLKNLKILSIEGCYRLESLPISFNQLENLEELYLGTCPIKSLPKEIGNLKKLIKLEIENCHNLESVSDSISELKSLEELRISCESLRRLPESFGTLRNLKELWIRGNYGLESLPGRIGNLESLERLSLIHCHYLESLPESIGNLKNLKSLILENCSKIPNIPGSIGNLQSLEIFKISYCNAIRYLPESLGNLRCLRELTIEGNNYLNSIPKSIDKLGSLQILIIQNLSNEFKHVSDGIGNLKSLTQFSISNCPGLEDLPNSIGKLRELKELTIIKCNLFNKLPESIGNLKNLTKLIIDNCEILEYLPDSISKIKSLEEIILKKCTNLKNIPRDITKLNNLRKLELNYCPNLQVNPDSFINFKSIEEITLIRCGLSALPDKLISFKQLKQLNLSDNIYSPQSNEKNKLIQKRWKKKYKPWRSIVLWGWDDKNNPSFLILYGKHEFMGVEINISKEDIEKYLKTISNTIQENEKPKIDEGIYNVLQDDVKYNCYAIFRGEEGHLPSFKSVQIIQKSHYDYKTRTYTYDDPEMYFKKGLKYSWGWRPDNEYEFKDFRNFGSKEQITFPYFADLSHTDYLKKIEEQTTPFTGFKLAKNPSEVLKINGVVDEYSKTLIDILSHQNLYMRKKFLSELLAKNPPKEVYKKILDVGSSEVISGLFLELAKLNHPALLEEAKSLVETEIKWVDDNYAHGVKRCAKIYINSLDSELKTKRIKWLRENLSKMDLHLRKVRGKEIPPIKKIGGATYRKYAQQGLFRDYYHYYNSEERKYIRDDAPQRYEVGPYTNGTKLNLIEFKNSIQEAEIYEIADFIGKLAYYLDAPRLTYYFKGSGKNKALKYFHRYIRRIINSYAERNEEKFMEVMKNLLTSYTKDDYVCKFPGNFQFNEILKYYLYNSFSGKAPRGWDNWSARYEWNTNDQLMKLEGRYEYKQEIWDKHLDIVAEIAAGAQIDQVVKACYYIFKESPNSSEFIENIDYNQLIQLALVSFKPLAEMFMNILLDKIDKLDQFDADLMLALIGCADEQMHKRAMDFFQRTEGKFSPQTVANLLFLENVDEWFELFKQNLTVLTSNQYTQFIRHIINKLHDFLEQNIILPENFSDILTMSTNKIQDLSKSEKAEVFTAITDVLFHEPKIPDWMATFVEELIFSLPYEDLEATVAEMRLEGITRASTSRNNRIISILKAIKYKKIPSDSEIINMLDFGTSKMIKIFLIIIGLNKEELSLRFPTLLIMFESEITALNQQAERIFNELPPEKQRKLHSIIIDSPVLRAYKFGLMKLDEIYKDMIPGEFIIQMLEHGANEVKAFISHKISRIIDNLGNGDKDLFMYYLKTLLLLPNKHSKSKDKVYEMLPKFVLIYKDKLSEIEQILLEIGGSNIIIDSERALVALAKIRKEIEFNTI